ncbi:MAG: hypothetical protein AB7I27_14380 [Bacteriovoracaceae bacterium]
MKIRKLILSCLLLSTNYLNAQAERYLSYRVRPGDTISEVLHNLGICPLWGKNKSIHQTVLLNPELIKSNGDFTREYQKILLPVSSLEESSDYLIRHGEVVFTNIKPEGKCGGNYIKRREVAQTNVKNPEPPVVVPLANTVPVNQDPAYGMLRLMTDLFYSGLDVTQKDNGSTAQFISGLNQAYQLFWEQVWDSENRSYLYYRRETQSYESISGKYSGQSYNLSGFGIGYERKVGQNTSVVFSTSTQQRLFVKADTLTDLKLQTVPVQDFSVSPKFKIVEKGPFKIHGDLGYAYLRATKTSDYTIKSGNRYFGGISLQQDIGNFALVGRWYYAQEEQDSSIVKRTVSNTGLSFGLSWKFGQ